MQREIYGHVTRVTCDHPDAQQSPRPPLLYSVISAFIFSSFFFVFAARY
jgi:hypothetical protein